MLFWPILGHFWCPIVTLVTFSSKLSNFKKNPTSPKKNPKKFKLKKIPKNPPKKEEN